jgi:putative flippase GtrA
VASSGTTERLTSLYQAHGEKLRYLIVGVWNTAFGYALFLLLLATVGPVLKPLSISSIPVVSFLGRNYYLAVQWMSWLVAVPQSTVTMKYLAFRRKGHLPSQIGRAYFIYLPAQGLSTLILWLSVRVVGLAPALGALAAIVVTTIFSYVGHKYFTFRVPLEVGEVPPEDLLEEVG